MQTSRQRLFFFFFFGECGNRRTGQHQSLRPPVEVDDAKNQAEEFRIRLAVLEMRVVLSFCFPTLQGQKKKKRICSSFTTATGPEARRHSSLPPQSEVPSFAGSKVVHFFSFHLRGRQARAPLEWKTKDKARLPPQMLRQSVWITDFTTLF